MEKRKLTNEKYMNLFKKGNYCWVERENTAAAVTVLPRLKKDGKEYFCFIREFRVAVGGYIYQLPAGLVESGESVYDTAVRELKEEIGASVISMREVVRGFTSAGLTNEFGVLFDAQIGELGTQNLQGEEDIEPILVERSEVRAFIDNNKEMFCLRSAQLALGALQPDEIK